MRPKAAGSDLLQGTLDLLILRTLSGGAMHGYAIAQRINLVSRALLQVPQGSLYPALHRLENRKWVKAEWDRTDTGREAKFYTLTREGRAQLAREQDAWQRLSEAMALVLAADPEKGAAS
ncbi:MAG: PadR family transcriptional regulator [Vicinamibacterales bacterium]|jgi:transcriptional regulator